MTRTIVSTMERDPLLTPAEAGAQLAMTPGQLATMRYRGNGPEYVKLTGRAIRYRQSALDLWVDSRARTSTED